MSWGGFAEIHADNSGNLLLRTYNGSALATGLNISGAGLVSIPLITTDATHTDATICEDTTTHVLYSGSGTLGICLGTSGRQFKTDFAAMQPGLAEVLKIPLYSYRYLAGYGDNGARRQYGTTAQDIATVMPELVGYNERGDIINYDYGALLFISLRAIQELKADNDNLRHELVKIAR